MLFLKLLAAAKLDIFLSVWVGLVYRLVEHPASVFCDVVIIQNRAVVKIEEPNFFVETQVECAWLS
jgi:hypothetical protein